MTSAMSDSVALPRSLINQLLHYAQLSPNAEVCGLVGSKCGMPVRCYPVTNADTQPECRFTMDPAEQIEAMRTLRERGEELFAVFHSHPTASAEPSALDIERAAYPDALHLIVSLNTQGVLELRGFRIGTDKTVREIALALEQPA